MTQDILEFSADFYDLSHENSFSRVSQDARKLNYNNK